MIDLYVKYFIKNFKNMSSTYVNINMSNYEESVENLNHLFKLVENDLDLIFNVLFKGPNNEEFEIFTLQMLM